MPKAVFWPKMTIFLSEDTKDAKNTSESIASESVITDIRTMAHFFRVYGELLCELSYNSVAQVIPQIQFCTPPSEDAKYAEKTSEHIASEPVITEICTVAHFFGLIGGF